jgi:dual 3',5'-cyclic-AMP and -GMP phosphodiesterase 11
MAGFTTDSLLCLPIRNAENDVIGVAQVINKNTPEGFFIEDDEKVGG